MRPNFVSNSSVIKFGATTATYIHHHPIRHRRRTCILKSVFKLRDSPIMSPAASPLPKRRRRRPARSCEQCRRRKIRCDQDQPCAGCVRAREPMQCTYRDGSPVDTSALSRKTNELAPVVSRSRTQSETSQSSRPALGRGLVVGYPRDQPAHEQPPAQQKKDKPSAPERENHSSYQSHHSAPLVLSSSSSITPVTPRLRNVPEKTKLFGQTHWLHTAEKVRFRLEQCDGSENPTK